MKYFQEAKANFLSFEKNLSPYATRSGDAIRLAPDDEDIRPPFFRDVDRIIHAMSYTRYIDKTQVYSFSMNDHLSKRIIHVQLVSKTARTIGRALGLNTDLIEAIALGHDIGHTPLGHTGEDFLNEISKREVGEYFAHNIQSVRTYMNLEKHGLGLNLSVQVLDGIMCHNGEFLSCRYAPEVKDKEEFLKEYQEAYTNLKKTSAHRPMTLEGCVVRVSDIIGYIGRDIEDAIEIGTIKREDIPKEIIEVLGCTNKEIMNTIILDVIDHSYGKPYLEFSEEVYQAMLALKKFNQKFIYQKSLSKEKKDFYREGMNKIYFRYLNDLETKNQNSIIYQFFLNHQKENYLANTSAKRIVIDFIAGMTDDFFLREIEK